MGLSEIALIAASQPQAVQPEMSHSYSEQEITLLRTAAGGQGTVTSCSPVSWSWGPGEPRIPCRLSFLSPVFFCSLMVLFTLTASLRLGSLFHISF